jgi:selenocysteine-specific elongation SelB-like protein
MDPAQRRLAERRLLTVLRRFHRAEPMTPGMRADALIGRVRALPDDRRPAGHRGSGRLAIDDAALHGVLDALVEDGRVLRRGHRVSLPEHGSELQGEAGQRVNGLLEELRAAGAAPGRVGPVARRLGVTPDLVEQLRRAGQLVHLGDGIDYPSDVYARLQERLDRLEREQPLTVGGVRDALGVSRRYAEALLHRRRLG